SDACGLVGKEALQRARPVQSNEIAIEYLGKAYLGSLREWMIARHDKDKPISTKRISLERASIDSAGHNAEIGNTFCDQPDDLVAQALLEIDTHIRMSRKKRAQGFRKEFSLRIGVGEYANLSR